MVLYIVAGAFGLVGAALGAGAVAGARRVRRLRSRGLPAVATVREVRGGQLRLERDGRHDMDDPVFTPVLEFTGADGGVHRFEGDATAPPRYEVGDRVPVLYDPAEPGGARIASFAGLWMGVLLLGLGAVVVLALTGVLFRLAAGGG